MTEHRYPPSAMISDYTMSGVGLLLSLPPAFMLDLPALTLGILGLMSLCFATYGIEVVRRQRTRVEIDEDGLSFSPPSRRIAWNEITRFRLAWFSTRRDGARGWMELKVESRVATLRVDSRLDRFPELVGHVWRAVARRGVEPDPTTRANLDALGVVAGEPDDGSRRAGPDTAIESARGTGRVDGGPAGSAGAPGMTARAPHVAIGGPEGAAGKPGTGEPE